MSRDVKILKEIVNELYEAKKETLEKKYCDVRNEINVKIRRKLANTLGIEYAGDIDTYIAGNRLVLEIPFNTLMTKEFICNVIGEIIPYTEQLNKLYADYKGDLERLDKWYSETLRALIEGKKFPSFPELMLEERW